MTLDAIACVLSGGGAKAAAHVGAVRAFSERGFTPTRYVGTSMGAVIGACYAAGQSYEEVVRKIIRMVRSDVARPSLTLVRGPWANSLLSGTRLRDTIAELVGVERFDELALPLTATATDIATGELVLFGDGGRDRVQLVDALYASCALPVYYPPGRIGDRDYVDGGMRSVLPLDVAFAFEPDAVLAVSIGPARFVESTGRDRNTLLRAHDRSVGVQMAVQTEREIDRWHDTEIPFVLVRPRRKARATFALQDVVSYVEEGYRAAVRALAEATLE